MDLLVNKSWADKTNEASHRRTCQAQDCFHWQRRREVSKGPFQDCQSSSTWQLSEPPGRLGCEPREPGHPTQKSKEKRPEKIVKQPALAPNSSLTIRDHDASYHGSKHNSQRQGFEPKRGHITPSSKGAIFLLEEKGQEGENEFSSCITIPQFLSNYSSSFVTSMLWFLQR